MQKLKKAVKCWYSEKVCYKMSTCYNRSLGQDKTSQEPSKNPLSQSEDCKDTKLCHWIAEVHKGDPRFLFRSSQLKNWRRRLVTNHLLVSVKCMEKVDIASRITINRADMLKKARLSKSEPTNWSQMETVTEKCALVQQLGKLGLKIGHLEFELYFWIIKIVGELINSLDFIMPNSWVSARKTCLTKPVCENSFKIWITGE